MENLDVQMDFLDKEAMDKLNVIIKYVSFECAICKHSWGMKIYNNKISARNLVCNNCAAEVFAKQV